MDDKYELFSPTALQLLARIECHPFDSLEHLNVDILNDVFGRCGAEDVLAAPRSRVKRKAGDDVISLDPSLHIDIDKPNTNLGSSSAKAVHAAPGPNVEYKTGDEANFALPGGSVFSFGPPLAERCKRSKYDLERRKEVSNVRKQGACFRCRVTKCPVSGRFLHVYPMRSINTWLRSF